ncbi:MAG: hypothetical protein Q8S18_07440 [Bacteroidales bacterium]|nr:hypothetical protein [Bacteroidales bacterium]
MDCLQTDEGHIRDKDELTAFAYWKIPELINEGWESTNILYFYDCELWRRVAENCLASLENTRM